MRLDGSGARCRASTLDHRPPRGSPAGDAGPRAALGLVPTRKQKHRSGCPTRPTGHGGRNGYGRRCLGFVAILCGFWVNGLTSPLVIPRQSRGIAPSGPAATTSFARLLPEPGEILRLRLGVTRADSRRECSSFTPATGAPLWATGGDARPSTRISGGPRGGRSRIGRFPCSSAPMAQCRPCPVPPSSSADPRRRDAAS
jgi:hypothetical protein